jgi:hypothetical protein
MSSNAGSTFMLVHGSAHGGWCWQKIVPALRAAGHGVFSPTLTGLGERGHLLRPYVGLEIHCQGTKRTGLGITRPRRRVRLYGLGA